MNEQPLCPVCNKQIAPNARYPIYVCLDDVARTTDAAGKPVRLYNTSMGGGFIAQYYDGSASEEVINSHKVYIDGKEFYADEARFGGIVVTPAE